jgi:hypothetical protein
MWPAIPAPRGWIGPVQCARLLALGERLLSLRLGVASCLVQLQGDDARQLGDRLPDGPGAQGRTAPDGGPHPEEGGGGRDDARRREATSR